MKIVIDETYDYAYNVWTYERGYVYDVEEVPRSGFYRIRRRAPGFSHGDIRRIFSCSQLMPRDASISSYDTF